MVAEIPPFTTTGSHVLTYLPYIEFRLYGGEHHSHNLPDWGPDSRSHRRASTSFLLQRQTFQVPDWIVGVRGQENVLRVAPSRRLLPDVGGSAQTMDFPIQYSAQIRVLPTLPKHTHPDLPIGVSKDLTLLGFYSPTSHFSRRTNPCIGPLSGTREFGFLPPYLSSTLSLPPAMVRKQ